MIHKITVNLGEKFLVFLCAYSVALCEIAIMKRHIKIHRATQWKLKKATFCSLHIYLFPFYLFSFKMARNYYRSKPVLSGLHSNDVVIYDVRFPNRQAFGKFLSPMDRWLLLPCRNKSLQLLFQNP